MIITRFAPSPTGRLHVGNLRTALHNWMLAKKHSGSFILRIDDTDAERSREEYVSQIRTDLSWLGIVPDQEERQSLRLERYDAAFTALKVAGRVYPAYETAQELELKRKVQLGRGLPPIYDRAALSLSPEQIDNYRAEGIEPHWRFKLNHHETIIWDDGVRGIQSFDPNLLSDPVILRADGSWLYMLPSAVDDLDMGVTNVLRGEDHVSNTAVQIQMFTALRQSEFMPQKSGLIKHPNFAHEALLVGKEGKLSKRLGSLGCDAFRDKGIEPQALVALLARLGTSLPVEATLDTTSLLDTFDLSTFGRAPAKFDEADLDRINTALVHSMPFAAAKAKLPRGMDEDGWHAVRPNVSTLAEAESWWKLVIGPIDRIEFSEEDRAFLLTAVGLFAWSEHPWHDLTVKMKEKTGRKGKDLFLPLRQALTGKSYGPDMGDLLPLIGEDEARKRLIRASE